MRDQRYHVLFLCTGNSARSIFAEVLLNQIGNGKFLAHSAGSHPSGRVHPRAIELLRSMRLPTETLRSKSWEEFAQAEAPAMDFVFTVCDQAAAEPCPIWPGQPMTAHWGIPDPAAVTGAREREIQAFRTAFYALQNRIRLFVSLPLSSLERMRLQRELDAIGRGAAEEA